MPTLGPRPQGKGEDTATKDNISEPCSLNRSSSKSTVGDGDNREEEEVAARESAMVQGVRIDPSKVHFRNTFEGKVFRTSVTFQNCGPRCAVVKYNGPTNNAFSYEQRKSGQRLSSGMRLKMGITYTYSQHCALSSYSIPVFINEEMFPLKIAVSNAVAKVSVDSTHIHFGLVDLGYNVATRTIKLKNSGSKLCKFAVHTPTQDVQLNVDPAKGILQPFSEVTINVEVSSLEEGDFRATFTVQCNVEIRVTVTGTVTMGKLEVCNMHSCDEFTLVEFPRTYCRTTCTQRLVLKNSSAARSVFCALFSSDDNQGEQMQDNKYFRISPMDGRLEPREAKIFTIEYEPTWAPNEESYHFAVLTIKKLNFWKDMNVNDYPEGLYKTLREYKRPELPQKKKSSSTIAQSIDGNQKKLTRSGSNTRSNTSDISEEEVLSEVPFMELESRIKVYLHGEPERVNVTCRPDEIVILDLTLNEPVDRVITIKNNSRCLPITFAYEKVAYINVSAKGATAIPPNSSVEVQVTVTVTSLGKVHSSISLLLLHTNSLDETVQVGRIVIPATLQGHCQAKRRGVRINPGITPGYIKEVGLNADRVAYCDGDVAIPRQTMDPARRKQRRNDADVIAFPNDRPKTLEQTRTGKENRITTIYAKIPRVVADNNDIDLRRGLFVNYLRHSRLDFLKALNSDALPEYEVTNMKKFLMFQYFSDCAVQEKTSLAPPVEAFIPLTPLQLNNIKVEPVYINVGFVAPYSRASKSFTITNENEVSIRVYIIPEKQRFVFRPGDGLIVRAHSTRTVDFTFFSEFAGSHSICIRLVINECHIFEVTVYTVVKQRYLLKSDALIRFAAGDPPFKFLNLYNHLNVDVDFLWSPSESNFMVDPVKGRVPPLKSVTCMITYGPLENKLDSAELALQTGPLLRQSCSVMAVPREIDTNFSDPTVNFGQVPMNMRVAKRAILWNLSNCAVNFRVTQPEEMADIQIRPESGCLRSKTSQVFTVTCKTLNCAPFKYEAVIRINDKPKHEITIRGEVVFPVVTYAPNPLKLKKFPVTSFVTFTVNITNKTKVPILMAFDFEQNMNCTVMDSQHGEQFRKGTFILEAKQDKFLYVFFDANDVTSLWFNMPFVLNDILGPPIGATEANKTSMYIKNKRFAVKPTISVMRVQAIICESDFTVSKHEFDFHHQPYCAPNNVCEDQAVFTNTSDKELEFCIRLDTVDLPFDISYEGGNELVQNECSLTFILQPGDSTTLAVKFTPAEFGTFYNTAAYYVRDDYQEDVHNFLHLRAVNEMPTFIVPETIYLEYIPRRFSFGRSFFVHAKNHAAECAVNVDCEHEDIQVLFRTEYRTEAMCKYEASLIYTSNYSTCFSKQIVFTCGCGGLAEVTCIGASENSLFTTYKIIRNLSDQIVVSQAESKQSDVTVFKDEEVSHIFANDLNTFPYFPEEGDDGYEYLSETIERLESWMCAQAFCGNVRHTIPDSFSMLTPVPKGEVDAKKVPPNSTRYAVPYMNLLRNVTSKSVADRIGLTVSCRNEVELARELQCLYKHVLVFLRDMNAYLPHVEPELLLGYDEYATYTSRIKSDRTKMGVGPTLHTEYNFYLLAKQAWLDVILQTLKIFVMGRIAVPTDYKEMALVGIEKENVPTPQPSQEFSAQLVRESVSQKSARFFEKVEQNAFSSDNILSEKECYLLNWIRYYYFNCIGEICTEDLDVLMDKRVDDYDSCFVDSLVLAAVIAAHCPYLKRSLCGLYWTPENFVQLHHNAAVVVQALQRINSTFELLPRNIYNPNNIQMVLLVAYLHEFLPCMHPCNAITVAAKLSTTSTIQISIDNQNAYEVTYGVYFFDNEEGCFSETRKAVSVSAKSTQHLGVLFQAKYIRQVTAVLIISGEVAGKRCAKSMAYELIGEPDVTHVIETYSLSGQYYTAEDHALEVQAPYATEAGCYDLHLAMVKPESYKDLHLHDCSTIIKEKIFMKFNFSASQAFFNERGRATVFLNSVTLIGGIRSVWVFFRNARLGDFAICIEMETVEPTEVELLQVSIPRRIYDYECTCGEKGTDCRKLVMIQVPNTNRMLMECFKREFVKMKGDHKEFWTWYLDKPVAFHHMSKTLDKTSNWSIFLVLQMLTDQKNYNVNIKGIGKNSRRYQDVTFPKTLNISGIEYGNMDAFTPFYIHVGKTPIPSFSMVLTTHTICELRKYKVIVSHY